ncbi:hypothetical protein FJY94_00145 [Candidatus Kaiserbacteria bacterium]|nr:hypothetical protein [Candidatus Kaiserbacteria bacterium]
MVEKLEALDEPVENVIRLVMRPLHDMQNDPEVNPDDLKACILVGVCCFGEGVAGRRLQTSAGDQVNIFLTPAGYEYYREFLQPEAA